MDKGFCVCVFNRPHPSRSWWAWACRLEAGTECAWMSHVFLNHQLSIIIDTKKWKLLNCNVGMGIEKWVVVVSESGKIAVNGRCVVCEPWASVWVYVEENIIVLAFAWSSFCTSVFYGTVFGVDRDISNGSFVFMVHCGNAVVFFSRIFIS